MNNKCEKDIHDRVAEAYYGEFGEKMKTETKKRLHWIRDNVAGDTVLDIGCSQGIGPILLGREGKKVLGIDISQKAVDEANEALIHEEEKVKENISFIKADFLKYSTGKKKFDTITITEVLEHLLNPNDFIVKANDLLVDNGTLIVTVPFGINDHPDHKKTYYFHDIYKMLSESFDIEEVTLLGKWIGFIARKRRDSLLDKNRQISLDQLKEIELGFYAIEREQVNLSKLYLEQRNNANQKYKDLWDKVRELTKNIDKKNQKIASYQNELKDANQKITSYQNELKDAKEQIVSEVRRVKFSPTFKLGYLFIHNTRSVEDIIKLPFRIWRIRNEKKTNVNLPKTKTHLEEQIKSAKKTPQSSLKPGVSIILPCYKSEKTIKRLLISLEQQAMDRKMFEILVIINGERDNTENIIKEFHKLHPTLNISIFILEKNGLSLARNKGLKEANCEYVALIDDDDSVSPNYLSSMYQLVSKNTIVFSQIVDVYDDYIDANNYINTNIMKTKRDDKNLLLSCHSACRLSACKLIATEYMREIQFDTSILNGEDGVFYAELYSRFDFDFKMCREATYYRFIVENSLSRQPMSFKFNVHDRLKVIDKNLHTLQKTKAKNVIQFIEIGVSGQIGFINKYLQKHPNDYMRVIEEIQSRNLPNFPYDKINKPQATELVISYCFIPYVDTSAIVMAKRILERNINADVVYANMSTVRDKDESLVELTKDLIINNIEIQVTPSFSNWKEIQKFTNKMMEKLDKFSVIEYETVYSRAMWPGSHFAAYEYKMKYPNTKWIAEFSDPILFDIHGKERYTEINNKNYLNEIQKQLEKQNISISDNNNLFFWCEHLAYAFADELVYTNKNQLSYMLEKTEKNLHEIIKNKAIIHSHPILPNQYYQIASSQYTLNHNKVHLAYFGTFYQTRKLNDIVEIIKVLPAQYRSQVVIHVFTNIVSKKCTAPRE